MSEQWFCIDPKECMCGGDTRAVRQTCSNYRSLRVDLDPPRGLNPALVPDPAPQPGWVATVTIKVLGLPTPESDCTHIQFPNEKDEWVFWDNIKDLPWQPPPPPPWEPEIGKRAEYQGLIYVLRDIRNGSAFAEDVEVDGEMYCLPLSQLSPPKGGGE